MAASQHSNQLSLRGQRAALLGSLWAANEIVLGSFLHNVGFPLTGVLLAAIGVCLLVAGIRLWNDRGVVWRAGLVCALMKSISPSAVILNPMIGIMAEASVLWFILLALGRNPVACIIGGLLVTVIPLLQQLINIIIAYGPDAAHLYAALYNTIASWSGIHGITPLQAIVIVALTSGIPGVVAAWIGIGVARRVTSLPRPERQQTTIDMLPTLDRLAPGQQFSLGLLAIHFIVLCLVLLLSSRMALEILTLCVVIYVGIVFLRYPALRRRFARPGLWLQFAAVASLAGFVLGWLGPMGSWWNGVRSGLQMTVRALFVVTAFGGISTELRNPRLVNWLLRRGLGSLGNALDAAFRSLPTMVAALGEHRSLLRRPVETVSRMFTVVLRELEENTHNVGSGPRVFILTGAQGAGKTSFLGRLIPLIRQQGKTVAGIIAPVVVNNGMRVGYNVEDIRSGDMLPLCRTAHRNAAMSIGPFGFDRDGLRFGAEALSLDAVAQRDVVILDEIGPLELAGGGWAPALLPLLESYDGTLLLVVRPDILQKVLQHWKIQPVMVWEPDMHQPMEIAARLAE
jgi:nucleoside-triphosphatase THEP1